LYAMQKYVGYGPLGRKWEKERELVHREWKEKGLETLNFINFG
jgi:hypothetical protein